jgi:hypothetical protein
LCTLAGMVCYFIVLLTVCLEPRDREDLGKTIVKIKNMARTCFGAPGPAPASVVVLLSPDALAAPAKSRQDGSG